MRCLPPPIPDPGRATLDSRHEDVEAEVRSEPAGDAANGRHPLRRRARLRADPRPLAHGLARQAQGCAMIKDDAQRGRQIPTGAVNFGDLRRTVPISSLWGFDRGQPIDRYYIEAFLQQREADIRGRVLEVGDPAYTRQFGGDRVTASDVLNLTAIPRTTVQADIACAPHIPSEIFHCIIFPQTLQLIYDLRAAAATLHRILRPEGVLLATFP